MVSIDGTDISSATIDGTDVSEITVDGDTVWTAIPAIPDSGISRWEFEQDAADSWGSNDGTVTGATFTTNSMVGNYALSLDGVDDYMEANQSINGLSAFSISVWADVTSTGDFGRICGQRNEASLVASWQGDGNPGFRVRGASNSALIQDSITTTNAGETHFVGTFANGSLALYRNGSQVATTSSSVSSPLDTDYPWRVGTVDPSASAEYVGGRVDDVRTYSKALSSTEVSNLYNTGSIDG